MEGQPLWPRRDGQAARSECPKRRIAGHQAWQWETEEAAASQTRAASISDLPARGHGQALPVRMFGGAGTRARARRPQAVRTQAAPRAKRKMVGRLVLSPGPGSGRFFNVPAAANPPAAANERPALLDLLVVFRHAGPVLRGCIKALRCRPRESSGLASHDAYSRGHNILTRGGDSGSSLT